MPEVAIDRSAIAETPFAWVLPWQDRRYLETGNLYYAVDGASPFVVMKEDGRVSSLAAIKRDLGGRTIEVGGGGHVEGRIALLVEKPGQSP